MRPQRRWLAILASGIFITYGAIAQNAPQPAPSANAVVPVVPVYAAVCSQCPVDADADALVKKLMPRIREAAQLHGVDPKLVGGILLYAFTVGDRPYVQTPGTYNNYNNGAPITAASDLSVPFEYVPAGIGNNGWRGSGVDVLEKVTAIIEKRPVRADPGVGTLYQTIGLVAAEVARLRDVVKSEAEAQAKQDALLASMRPREPDGPAPEPSPVPPPVSEFEAVAKRFEREHPAYNWSRRGNITAPDFLLGTTDKVQQLIAAPAAKVEYVDKPMLTDKGYRIYRRPKDKLQSKPIELSQGPGWCYGEPAYALDAASALSRRPRAEYYVDLGKQVKCGNDTWLLVQAGDEPVRGWVRESVVQGNLLARWQPSPWCKVVPSSSEGCAAAFETGDKVGVVRTQLKNNLTGKTFAYAIPQDLQQRIIDQQTKLMQDQFLQQQQASGAVPVGVTPGSPNLPPAFGGMIGGGYPMSGAMGVPAGMGGGMGTMGMQSGSACPNCTMGVGFGVGGPPPPLADLAKGFPGPSDTERMYAKLYEETAPLSDADRKAVLEDIRKFKERANKVLETTPWGKSERRSQGYNSSGNPARDKFARLLRTFTLYCENKESGPCVGNRKALHEFLQSYPIEKLKDQRPNYSGAYEYLHAPPFFQNANAKEEHKGQFGGLTTDVQEDFVRRIVTPFEKCKAAVDKYPKAKELIGWAEFSLRARVQALAADLGKNQDAGYVAGYDNFQNSRMNIPGLISSLDSELQPLLEVCRIFEPLSVEDAEAQRRWGNGEPDPCVVRAYLPGDPWKRIQDVRRDVLAAALPTDADRDAYLALGLQNAGTQLLPPTMTLEESQIRADFQAQTQAITKACGADLVTFVSRPWEAVGANRIFLPGLSSGQVAFDTSHLTCDLPPLDRSEGSTLPMSPEAPKQEKAK